MFCLETVGIKHLDWKKATLHYLSPNYLSNLTCICKRIQLPWKLRFVFFFPLLIAASGNGGKIANFCLGVHLFLKLFNSAGVRNVHLHCGNDQAVKSAWRRGWQRCITPTRLLVLCSGRGEGCSPCFCSGVLTSQDITKFGTARGDMSGKPLGAGGPWKFCFATCKSILFPNRISHQSSPPHRDPVPHHSHLAGWILLAEAAACVKPSCRTRRCNPPAATPFPTGG